MRALLSVALAAGLVGFTRADEKKADAVGTWKCEYDIGGQKRTSTLKVQKDGDGFAETMTWPDQKEANLKGLKFKDGELTFSAVRELMDNKITLDYALKVDRDALKGKGSVDAGGEKREFKITGKREKEKKDG